MKRTLCNSRPIRSFSTLVLGAALLRALALPEAVAAGAPSLPVEQVLREFQARCYFVTGGYATWQPCRCGTPAPAFPPDGFYGNLDRDPVLATLLVRDLAGAFYSRNLYAPFLKTPDGSIGIEGQPATLDPRPLTNYTLVDDMSPLIGGIDMSNPSNISTTNYPDCFRALRGYIEKLNFVSVPVGAEGFAAKFVSCSSLTNCDEAKALAANAYTAAPWPDEGGGGELDLADIHVSARTWSSETLPPTYYAEKEARRARIYGQVAYYYPRLAGGTILLYLAATNYSGGDGGNGGPVTADGRYQQYSSTPLEAGSDFYSPLLGDATNVFIGSNCPLDVPVEEGWYLLDGFMVLKPDFQADPDHVQCGEDVCVSCEGGGNLPGKVTTATGSLDVRISLGPNQYGRPAGYFYLHSEHASPALFSPGRLLYSKTAGTTPAETGAVPESGGEVSTHNVTAHVQTNGTGYAIYFTNNIAPHELLSWVGIQSNGTPNQMVVTEVLGPNGSPRLIQFNYTSNGPTSWTWHMIEGGGLRAESRTTTWTSATNRTDSIVVKGLDEVPVAQTLESYCRYPWGQTLVQRVEGTGASARTTSWTYYTNAATDGGNYGQLKQVVEPSGRWEKYQYDAAGRLLNTVAQFGNNSSDTDAGSNRVTEVSYSNDVITTVVKLLDQEVSRTYEVHAWDEYSALEEVQTIRCVAPGAGIGATNNLTNIVWQTTHASNSAGSGQAWDTVKAQREDGTTSFYTYGLASEGWRTTSRSGAPNSGRTDITNGTEATRVVGDWGEPLATETRDIASGLLLDQQVYDNYDTLKRSHKVTHPDNTTETFTYSCCGLYRYTDRDGVTTEYAYDDAKRRTASSRVDILTTNVLDAAGNVLKTVRIGTDNSSVLLSRAGYDLAGRVLFETNALGGATTRTETFGASGRTVSTTYPDNGTRVEVFNQDGSLQSVSGTAAFPAYYTYGVDAGAAYTKETKDSPSGSEWTKTYTDMLGRAYKTVYAGPDTPFSIAYYNARGQVTNEVDPDGVSMLYTYNATGERACSILDSNRNRQIDWTGADADRITLVTNDVTSEYGPTARRTRTFVWAESDDTRTLISSEAASADGLQTWSTVWNNGAALTRHSQTVCDSATGLRVTTTTAPDNSSAVTTNQYGRRLSVTRKDANGAPLGQTLYGYDAHGRPNTITDARNGTATRTYKSGTDLIETVTTPSPGNGPPAQTTTLHYNQMLQVTNALQPDQTSVFTQYEAHGLAAQTWGARTYPAGYSFASQGQLATMTNWSTFPSTGARVTTWNYDLYRGWLSSKTYDGGAAGPAYGHTAAGRLHTRTWARGVNTLYTTNSAGELSAVSYDDGQTQGLALGHDRRGRQTTIHQGNITTIHTLDDAGNLRTETYSGGPLHGLSVTNGYDDLLRRTNAVLLSPQGVVLASTTYAFDSASRLKTISDGTNNATYDYLANSPLAGQVTFKQGSAVRMTATKQYDRLNRLLSVASAPSAGSPVSFAYGYNFANQRTNVTLADNSRWAYVNDQLGQLTSGRKYWGDGTPVAGQQFGYTFDDVGNRLTATSGGDNAGQNLHAASYTNNSLNQITGRTVPGYLQVLGAANSNATVTLWSRAGPLATPAGNFAQTLRHGEYFSGELAPNSATGAVWLAITNLAVCQNGTNADHAATNVGYMFLPQTPEIYGYDEDGSLTNNGRFTITWDAENRATSFTSLASNPLNSKRRVECTYDYSWRRTQKIVSTNNGSTYGAQYTQRFVYDGWNLMAELGPEGTLLRSHFWGLDTSGSPQGAGGVGGLLATTIHTGPFAGTYFPAYDGSHNVVAYVRASDGQVVARYEHGPFGELLRASGPMAWEFNLLFSTKYYDWETGFYYYGYRYYDPSTGRWLSRDPLEEGGGWGLYGFVGNCAPDRIDALGLFGGPAWDRYSGWTDQDREDYGRGVLSTVQGMGQGALAVGKEVGSFAGDLLLGFVVVVTSDCCCNSLLTGLNDIGYKGSSLTAQAGGDYGGVKTAGRVFIAPVVAAVSVPVNGYQSVQSALNGDLNAAGNKMGQSLTTVGFLAAPFAKGSGGTGGYTGIGTAGEAVYNLAPGLLKTLPARTALEIRSRAGVRCESSLIQDMGPDAVQNLQIHPRLPSGDLATWWFTADGVCSRSGGFIIREFKASSVAPLSPRQTQAFPLLDQFGGAVRGIKGGRSIPQGTILPPIRVQVIRQTQFEASELVLPALGGQDSP